VSFLNAADVNSRDKKNFHGIRQAMAGASGEICLTHPNASLAGRRCLVLDDEILIALDIQNILEAAGASVTPAADADEALKHLDGEDRFDIAVVDVRLGATTTSTAVTMRLIELEIPFVFLAGLRIDDVHVHHPDVVIEKPYVAEALLKAVDKAPASQ
jgi:CheY-like chemotaxis protein